MTSFGVVIIDFFSSLVTSLSLVIASLTRLFLVFIRVVKSIPFAVTLLKNGLLNIFLIMKLNELAGRKAEAESLLLNLQRKVEGLYKDCGVESLRGIYIDLSNQAIRQYINTGKVEDACLLVIRVAKLLELEAIPGYEGFDVNLAHVVKAGVSAAKLLSEGGLATMMLNPQEAPIVEGANDNKLKNIKVRKEGDCKIIEFPDLNPTL